MTPPVESIAVNRSDANESHHPIPRSLTANACVRLSLLVVALWALMAVPAWLLDGMTGLRGLSVAAVLCLIPGCGVLVFAETPFVKSQPMLPLLASGVRMGIVMLFTVVLNRTVPGFGLREFILWLVVMYMATLAFETKHIVDRVS